MDDRPSGWARPSEATRKHQSVYENLPPPTHEHVRKARDDAGQNIWTGEQLSGDDARHWLRKWVGLPERFPRDGSERWGETVESIVSANNERTTFLLKDGTAVTLARTVTREKVVHKGKQRKRRRIEFKIVDANGVTNEQSGKAESGYQELRGNAEQVPAVRGS